MPTVEDAVADAYKEQHSIRALAYAMRAISDPNLDYPPLPSLALRLALLDFELSQLARFYETTATERTEVHGDRDAGRTSAQRVIEHLRAASESVARAVDSLTEAHNADSEISYDPPHTVETNEPWL